MDGSITNNHNNNNNNNNSVILIIWWMCYKREKKIFIRLYEYDKNKNICKQKTKYKRSEQITRFTRETTTNTQQQKLNQLFSLKQHRNKKTKQK